MKINLNEISEEGSSFIYTQDNKEMSLILKDLLDGHNFNIDLFLKSIGNTGTYEARGTVKSSASEDCSRCGLDFELAINERYTHLLVPGSALEAPRDGKFSKANHYTDLENNNLDITEYSGHHFNVGDFFHELIALAIPYNPVPNLDSCGKCVTCGKNITNQPFSYDEEMVAKVNPFDALKNIKIN